MIRLGAFKNSIAADDIRALFNHYVNFSAWAKRQQQNAAP
jgi:phage head maturation protease